MSRYSRNEFPYARPVANAILNDKEFRRWFLAKTKFVDVAASAHPLPELQARLRSTKQAQKWFWFNYFCNKTGGCSCRVGTGIETDILIVLETPDQFRFAVHIEVKKPGEDLEDGQAESYPRRATCWVNPATRSPRVPSHHDFVTILVCGENLQSDIRTSEFDAVVLHRDIEQRLSPYPDSVDLRDTEMIEQG